MTLEYREKYYNNVIRRIVECPFCGFDLRGKKVPEHIRKCPKVPR